MLSVCWVFDALLCAAVLTLFLTRYALTGHSEDCQVLSSLYDSPCPTSTASGRSRMVQTVHLPVTVEGTYLVQSKRTSGTCRHVPGVSLDREALVFGTSPTLLMGR